MKDIPTIIVNSLKKDDFRCERCKAPFNVNSVKAIGVRDSKKNPSQQLLFIEYKCECRDSISIEFQSMSLMGFALMILHSFDEGLAGIVEDELVSNPYFTSKKETEDTVGTTQKEEQKKEKKPKVTQISKKELDDAVSFLNRIKYFDEVLESMGIYNEQCKKKSNRNKGEKSE